MTETAATIDHDMDTLHLRCGSDIRDALRSAGFRGDFLEFADPYCQGPVPDSDDFLAQRASFLSSAYELDLDALRRRQQREEAALAGAAAYPRVLLWFEHDSYDQLILARVLNDLASAATATRVELICIDSFPGIPRFVGLGQLAPEDLRSLWPQRQPLGAEQFALGKRVWKALRRNTPLALQEIAAAGTAAIPPMAAALRRHLQELPWTTDGLSLTQRLTLQALGDGPQSAGQVFSSLNSEREPLPYLGDQMYWHELAQLLAATRPALSVSDDTREQPWPRRRLQLTGTGQALLARGEDWLSCGPRTRWLGGIRIDAAVAGWRWSEEAGAPLQY